MARMTVGVVFRRPSVLLLFTLMTSFRTSHASGSFELLPRSSNSCPSSYDTCGGNLPSDFCCASSSTCISLDDATSAICCPSGANCDYISPIVCDIQQQNATAHPENSVKTSRLDDSLPTCGDACCPFGYTCQGNNTCALNKKTSSSATSTSSTSSSASTTSPSATSSATSGITFAPVPSSSISAAKENANGATLASSCPSFPSKAIAAGFFPGAIFGALVALLITTCLRRRARKKEQGQGWEPKLKAWSQRSSTGGVVGISRPIHSEDYGRSDFLLHPSPVRRSYVSGRSTRSRLHRTGSRVRSLFSNGTPRLDKEIPPIPSCPVTPPPQRKPSTESIKVYSPPGAFAQSRKFLGPEPYPSTIARPDTTFTDLMRVVGFNDPKGNPSYKVTKEEEKFESKTG
ncbi:uncharacterized protein N7498_006748 [Penicillium cinerascens]|uniref:Uncharacterized protein n=1 Tax=Penicillium cinerascens TaxID=70096 RepID=A0A9W9SY15_9EURO|nr:uncharacterized protein N7498_006748 [Penicillium cinerascens]KAJ5202085.1 hypothetical protein N7498_006748 [Penicillium cinerascens]